jgi:hypothetical protein
MARGNQPRQHRHGNFFRGGRPDSQARRRRYGVHSLRVMTLVLEQLFQLVCFPFAGDEGTVKSIDAERCL